MMSDSLIFNNLVHKLAIKTIIMAQKTFMKIDQVDGESQDLHHKKEIEVLNWTWTM